jgi:hypothetical protein
MKMIFGKSRQLVYHQFLLLYLEEEVKYRVASQRCRRVEHFSDTVSVVPSNSPGRATIITPDAVENCLTKAIRLQQLIFFSLFYDLCKKFLFPDEAWFHLSRSLKIIVDIKGVF